MASLRSPYQFFFAKAAHVVGERAEGALALARAEAGLATALERGDAKVTWDYDETTDVSWADEETMANIRDGRLMCMTLVIEKRAPCGHFEVAAALGGIVTDGDAIDRRLYEAEVALEAGFNESIEIPTTTNHNPDHSLN